MPARRLLALLMGICCAHEICAQQPMIPAGALANPAVMPTAVPIVRYGLPVAVPQDTAVAPAASTNINMQPTAGSVAPVAYAVPANTQAYNVGAQSPSNLVPTTLAAAQPAAIVPAPPATNRMIYDPNIQPANNHGVYAPPTAAYGTPAMPAPLPVGSGTMQPMSQHDLQTRIQLLERQVEALSANPVQHVAPHEVDDTLLDALADRWDRMSDPEIEIVRYQTASAREADKKAESKEKKGPKKWYEKLNIRGYTQVRINDVTELEPGSAPAQYVGDRSVGADQSFLIRRARLILFGDVSDHMYVYLQPDFAVTTPGSTDGTHFTQIRDWYADLYIDKTKVHRVRVGQSKIPYGWENLQSSSNRLPLDRSDPINSAARNERDLGVFYYWTPEPAQEFFKDVMDMGLKGSGNYGVFGFGFYNGQGGSLLEQNDNTHIIARLALPWVTENCQHMELGIQGYTGRYTVLSSQIRALGAGPAIRPAGTLETGNTDGWRDERVAGTFVLYPEPFGFQTEWNVGRGPALNAAQTAIEERSLYGGYAMVMYRRELANKGSLIPFARYAFYQGGMKSERNAPFAMVDEWEFGLEWQMNQQMELTTMYTWTDRTNTTAFNQPGVTPYQQFDGELLRFQFQFNY